VETRAGLTLPSENRKMVRYSKEKTPLREVSSVTGRSFSKKRLMEKLKEKVMEDVPDSMKHLRGREALVV